MLEVTNLTRRFGGLVANDAISFRAEAGGILGVIGPNGAGKSTLFELITGFETPDEGDVRLDGPVDPGPRAAPDQPPRRRAHVPEAQALRPHDGRGERDGGHHAARFEPASCAGCGARGTRLRRPARQAARSRPRPEHRAAQAPGARPGHGNPSPACCCSTRVTGGVDQRSIPGLIELIERLRREGMTIILIEHDMQVLMSLADRVVALHLGAKIAEGDAGVHPGRPRRRRVIPRCFLCLRSRIWKSATATTR